MVPSVRGRFNMIITLDVVSYYFVCDTYSLRSRLVFILCGESLRVSELNESRSRLWFDCFHGWHVIGVYYSPRYISLVCYT